MGKSNLEQLLQIESDLVRYESMIVLKVFEDGDDFDLDCYSAYDPKSSNESI